MTTQPTDSARPLPIDLIEGPTGLLYLIPYAPLTLDDCEALSAILAARVATMRPCTTEGGRASSSDCRQPQSDVSS
ncbi:hypothetical protein Misp03_59110 [Microbispora sp. NBRC 16548]|nr:hypothetical protein Misp03_59110 [Microbispora sp. NBRC 16548]